MEIVNHCDIIDEKYSTDENIMSDGTVSVVLEEAEIIECDADIEADDDNIQYHLYALNKDDNAMAYKFLHISENCRENSEFSTVTPLTPVHNAVQMVSPLNGQLYVLGNSSTTDVITSEYAKTFSSRVTTCKLQLEGSQNIVTRVKKRDEKRRTHNEIERRRRDKINNWITKLGKLLADCDGKKKKEEDSKTNVEPQSKGGILARTCEYITELREAHEKLIQSMDESARLMEEAKNLRHLVDQLKDENSKLKIRISKGKTFTLDT